ncbi:MAG: putative toxin-antitoxin system toxin component, PIN family [Nanoarchaeota archaeon]|nr:putative toxin-antitoxin system toxin component, PIN family [Nanoarchaeota archaeon]
MRVVLDTNVFISGIHWSGSSEKILHAWFDDKFELISSEETIEEIAETLANFKIPLPKDDILHWISIIAGKSILVKPETSLDIIKDDPDDNKFLEIALEGKADYIVSQDKHLLKLKEFEGIKILSPDEFLREL